MLMDANLLEVSDIHNTAVTFAICVAVNAL